MSKLDIVINELKKLPKMEVLFGDKYINFKCETKYEAYAIVKALYKLGMRICNEKNKTFDEISQTFFEDMWSACTKNGAKYFYVSIDWNYLITKECDVIHFCWSSNDKRIDSITFKETIEVLRETRKEVKEYERNI